MSGRVKGASPCRTVVGDSLCLLMHGSHQSISQHSLLSLAFPEKEDEDLKDRWKYLGIRGESGENKGTGWFPSMPWRDQNSPGYPMISQ